MQESIVKYIVHSSYTLNQAVFSKYLLSLYTHVRLKTIQKATLWGFAQWKMKHYCRKRSLLIAKVWAEGQHELLKMVVFDYHCLPNIN